MTGGVKTAEQALAHPYRWAMLAGVCLAYFCFGMTMVTLAPLVGPVTHDLAMSRSQMVGKPISPI